MAAIAPPGSYGKIAVTINPTDPKYAVDAAKYPPNKSSLWSTAMELDGWFLEHCNIRSEVAKMTKVLKTLGGKTLAEWEVASLRAWFTNHDAHIHTHHADEDDIFTPVPVLRLEPLSL